VRGPVTAVATAGLAGPVASEREAAPRRAGPAMEVLAAAAPARAPHLAPAATVVVAAVAAGSAAPAAKAVCCLAAAAAAARATRPGATRQWRRTRPIPPKS